MSIEEEIAFLRRLPKYDYVAEGTVGVGPKRGDLLFFRYTRKEKNKFFVGEGCFALSINDYWLKGNKIFACFYSPDLFSLRKTLASDGKTIFYQSDDIPSTVEAFEVRFDFSAAPGKMLYFIVDGKGDKTYFDTTGEGITY